MLRFLLAFAFGGAIAISAPFAQEPAPAPSTGVHLRLRVEPFVDAFAHVRHGAEKIAAEPTSADAPTELAAAVAIARALERDLGSPLLWGPIEGCIASARSAAEAREHAAELPEKRELRSGTTLALRGRALELIAALERYEPVHRATLWPENEAALRAAATELERRLLPREQELFAQLRQHLGFEVAELEIPVLLVRRGAAPGAVTVRDASGRGACFVALEAGAGTLLDETVLHEAMHALDLASPRSVLAELRARLGAAGFGPRDRELRDAPHALIFAEAGELVRRLLDPEHRSYAEVHGIYARLGAYAAELPVLWRRHLSGELDRAQTLDALVAAVRASREKK
jgi:hypothetical protein